MRAERGRIENSLKAGRLCHLGLTGNGAGALCIRTISESEVVVMRKHILRVIILILVFLIAFTEKVK